MLNIRCAKFAFQVPALAIKARCTLLSWKTPPLTTSTTDCISGPNDSRDTCLDTRGDNRLDNNLGNSLDNSLEDGPVETPDNSLDNDVNNNLDNMAGNIEANLLTLPGEVRQMIWERVFDPLKYHAGDDHYHHCPDAVDRAATTAGQHPPTPRPCLCNNRQFHVRTLCRQVHNEMQAAVEKAFTSSLIDANYTIPTRFIRLQPDAEQRLRSLTLDATVYPLIGCGVGTLEDIRYDDFLTTFPNLKYIHMPEDLGTGLGLRFAAHIPLHIESCLRRQGGPDEMPNADMAELVRSDLDGQGESFGEDFDHMESIILAAGIEITSTYRYRVSVAVMQEPPFSENMKVYDKTLCGVSTSPTSLVDGMWEDLEGDRWDANECFTVVVQRRAPASEHLTLPLYYRTSC